MISSIQFKNTNIDVLRLDAMNLPVGGNKFYKLKYNIAEALEMNFPSLITFGGAFSNHVCAVALAGKLNNLKTIGVIRGEDDTNNPTLNFCREQGMFLHFMSREDYKNKYDENFIDACINKFGDIYLLPEGGTNALALKGTSEILTGIDIQYDHIICAVGTGGTLAGIISTPDLRSKVTGISVLKGDTNLSEKVSSLLDVENENWEINYNYHLGGYAKYNTELMEFILQFEKTYSILLDPVYTGKVFYAIFDMIDKKQIAPDQKILAIHTGGLQGWAGWKYRYNK
ncbi:MAG: 1-aminocyclopropane-1-carboxylate deaminase/D-cysteine desulfhydrase [Chitinophagales bacterium]